MTEADQPEAAPDQGAVALWPIIVTRQTGDRRSRYLSRWGQPKPVFQIEVLETTGEHSDLDPEGEVGCWVLRVWKGSRVDGLPGLWTTEDAAVRAAIQLCYVLEAPTLWELFRDAEDETIRHERFEREREERQARADEEADRREQEKYDQRRARAKERRADKRAKAEYLKMLHDATERGLVFHGPKEAESVEERYPAGSGNWSERMRFDRVLYQRRLLKEKWVK